MARADDFILLDVRTDDEYKEKRIEGAILIPDYEIKARTETELPDKDALLLVYCRSGRRSANAANELVSMDYTICMTLAASTTGRMKRRTIKTRETVNNKSQMII